MKKTYVRVGKFLSLLQRHRPEEVGVTPDREVTFGGGERR